MCSGTFGKYGYGLKTCFKMGANVTVSVRTKRAESKVVWIATLDAGKMRTSDDKRHMAVIECIDAPPTFGQEGTEISIEHVDESFWMEWKAEGKPAGEEIVQRISERYVLYTTKSSALMQIPEQRGRRGPDRTAPTYCKLPPIGIKLNGSPISHESTIAKLLAAINQDHVHTWSVEVWDPEDDSVVLSRVEVCLSSLPHCGPVAL